VPCQYAGTFVDVALQQGADAAPERRDQAGPGVVEPGSQLVSRTHGISEQASEQPAIGLVIDRLAAQSKLAGNYSWPGRADLGQLVHTPA
jgi:hypothetical protein